MLLSVLTAQGARITFFTTDLPAGTEDMKAYNGHTQLPSGAVVSTGARITFVAHEAQGYMIDWYVNDELQTGIHDYTLVRTITSNVTVEARYHEPYKLIFKDTPFVKYADANGIVYLGANFYHYTAPTNQYGASVVAWKTEAGTEHPVDNNPNDSIVSMMTLQGDSIMTPVYEANDDDLGDACGLATWSFAHADSTLLFANFKGVCHYMQPTDLKAAYVDVGMVCDATNGLIDNSQRLGMGNTRVDAGTRFRLPCLYGTVFTLVGTNDFTATTIDGKAPQRGRQGELFTASLTVLDVFKDSIDILMGEDQYLVSISANYPGGYTNMKWLPAVGTAESTVSTVGKTSNGGSLIDNLSDITLHGGLTVNPFRCDTLSSQIDVTQQRIASRYLSVSFRVANDFSLQADSIIVPIYPMGAGKNCSVELRIEDERGHKLDSIFSKVTSDSLCHYTLVAPQNTAISSPTALYLYGKVTVKCWVYGADAYYCLASPITVSGTICETITCGAGETWATYVTKGGLNLEKLTGLSVYKVTSIHEKNKPYVVKEQMEEVRKGEVALINTQEPGFVYNTPLSRADDAATPNNILRVSDGTVTGNQSRYTFGKTNGSYAFRLVPAGQLIPEGEVYLEWDTFTTPEYFYLSEADVPTTISALRSQQQPLATGKTYRIVKNGQIYIVRPDGSVYTLRGQRVM